jgi:hypothetical protein
VAVRLVPSAVDWPGVAERPRTREGNWTQWLILVGYLLGAVAVTSRLWADPAGRMVGFPGDVDLVAWFMRHDATAVAHGRLPGLVTSAMNAPRGIGLMWNVSLLLPGVLLSPVTLLAGPQASLTILVTLGFAGSAASLFVVLRRWGGSVTTSALGGAVYGFSPAMLASAMGHYHVQFAVLPPLMIDALLRIVTGRGAPVRTGTWLGLLAAAQVFISEELLADTVLAGLVLLAVLVADAPREAVKRARATATGLATGTGVTLLICGYALWTQFRGPLSEHGSPWSTGEFRNLPAAFVTPSAGLLFHTQASAAAAARYPLPGPEYVAYVGLPLLVVLLAAAIRFGRDPRVRVMAVTFAVLEVLSLGSRALVFGGIRYPGFLLPWHWLHGLPLLGQILPNRLSVLADGAAAAVLAFSLDLARSPAPQGTGGQGTGGQGSGGQRRIATAIAVLAILPLIPLPLRAAATTPVPAGWRATFAGLHLAPGARVLVVPVPYSREPQALRWQADTGEPGSLIGGYFIGPDQKGRARRYGTGRRETEKILDALWAGSRRSRHPPLPQVIRSDLAYWRPAAVVAVTSPNSRLARLLTGLFGPPALRTGGVLSWRL